MQPEQRQADGQETRDTRAGDSELLNTVKVLAKGS